MMRKCHLNTCPVGVATQDPVLRKRFNGQPEHVINYFFFVAEEVRRIMADLGFSKFDEMIGQLEVLDKEKAIDHWKANGLDFSNLFHDPREDKDTISYNNEKQSHPIHDVLDIKLIDSAMPALVDKTPVNASFQIKNNNRSTGAMLSGEVARRFGHKGLPEDTISIKFNGITGQAFGAWLAKGVTLEVEGEANDYVGKGLSGGKLIIYPPKEATKIVPESSIIAGNTVLYGAIEESVTSVAWLEKGSQLEIRGLQLLLKV